MKIKTIVKTVTIGTLFLFLVNLVDIIANGLTIFDRFLGGVEENVNTAHANYLFDEKQLSTTSPINRILSIVDKGEYCVLIEDTSQEENRNSFIFKEILKILEGYEIYVKHSPVASGYCDNQLTVLVESRYIKSNPEEFSSLDSDGMYSRKIGFSISVLDSNQYELHFKSSDVVGIGLSRIDAEQNAKNKIINWLNRNL